MCAFVEIVTAPQALAAPCVVFVGRRAALEEPGVGGLLPPSLAPEVWLALLDAARPQDGAGAATTFLPGEGPRRLAAVVIDSEVSRHGSPVHAPALVGALRGVGAGPEVGLVLVASEPEEATAMALAAARAAPGWSARGGTARRWSVATTGAPLDGVQPAVDAVLATRTLVDRPPCEVNVDAFVAEAQAVATRVGATCEVLRGDALGEAGLGGLAAVGRAALEPPALVVLAAGPDGVRPTAWVGKGIVYDTGGLALKPKPTMAGMKGDMAGAAAVLHAFGAAAARGLDRRLFAVLCLAENAIGPHALRNDDIIRLHSGRTVEVNNTDAEGRLVLADGVSWAARVLGALEIVDMATLTGAQSGATGKRVAALLSKSEALERRAVLAGRRSGDLAHPLPWTPELLRAEFKSVVADMKNSVKDRNNAQAACAGLFIAEHLPPGWAGDWLHVDMAGPSRLDDRATGYGVGLLLGLLDA